MLYISNGSAGNQTFAFTIQLKTGVFESELLVWPLLLLFRNYKFIPELSNDNFYFIYWHTFQNYMN